MQEIIKDEKQLQPFIEKFSEKQKEIISSPEKYLGIAAEKTEKACTDWSERNVTPHSLRHSLNSHLLAAGADPIKVRAFMGWSDNVFHPVLTPVQAGYTRWPPEHLRDLIPQIDKIFRTV